MVLSRIFGMFSMCRRACNRLRSCLQVSPLVILFTAVAVLVIISLVLVFNICLARLFTVPGALAVNIALIWLLLRVVVRVLVFPGSIVLWKRNTEASYRVEMAKQFMQHLFQLHTYVQAAADPDRMRGSPPPNGTSMEGAMLGSMVVEGLARNFRLQRQDKVRATAEQTRVSTLLQDIEKWIHGAKVCDRGGKGPQMLLTEWLARFSQGIVPVQLSAAVTSAPLTKEAAAGAAACIDHIEELMAILNGLQLQEDGCCSSAKRFLRTPTLGSLHQLRAELVVRYGGHQCWVTKKNGSKIDGMLISAQDPEAGAHNDQPGSSKEDQPLKDGLEELPVGPVIVWCGPNAAYYETMAYESHWLDFYLAQGCSVFVFNYSGFGRSQGRPTPSALAADGNAVIEFLRKQGFTQVGVHGRSIGGIAACSLARNNPDIVKMLVADRTFSTLAKAAKYTFGDWAVKGLGLAMTWADNFSNYSQCRCYKVMLCDPKDATIPDVAALRSAVAEAAVAQIPPSERLIAEDDRVNRLYDAWAFFDTLVGVCDRSAAKRAPRPDLVYGKPSAEADIRIDIADDGSDRTPSRGRGGGAEARKCAMNAQWLEDHGEIVQQVVGPHINAIRLAIDVAGMQVNASGMTLDDALGRPSLAEARDTLRCFVANMQVWGSLGVPLCHAVDKDIEHFLQKGVDSGVPAARLAKLLPSLAPERLAAYHRRLSRSIVAQVRREFRQCLSTIRRALEESPAGGGRDVRDDDVALQLCGVVMTHLREVESFLTVIYRFFKCVDFAGAALTGPPAPPDVGGSSGADPAAMSDDSESGHPGDPQGAAPSPPRPVLDRAAVGHVVCLECGHNGVLNQGEMQHLALHLRAARFGKYSGESGGDIGV
mmetsp:Transcript_101256/g.287111  ORF Transcript_101256/g.287111 Transcript_101256/m.287111 type:complete len:876 (+) Transcript_101256:75-2702(+)